MINIFSNIQHYFVSVITAVSATLLVIFPFTKPQTNPLPTPFPVSIQEMKSVGTSPSIVPKVKKINQVPTPVPTPTQLPQTSSTAPSPLPIYQAPKVSLETLCKGFADELAATTKTMVGLSIYNLNPYYELTTTKFYNYCLANNGNTNGFKVEPPPVLPIPTIAPVVIQDNSAWIQSCNDSIARIEADKQKAVNEVIVLVEKECSRRGLDHSGCESYTQPYVDKITPFYDGQIRDWKFNTGCL